MLSPTLLAGLGALALSQAQPEPLRLPDVVREALAHNPEIAQAEASVATVRAGEAVAGARPEPVFSYQAWQQPLAHPFDPTQTDMHMIGLRQSLPFPGQLGRAERAAQAGTLAQQAEARSVRLKVQAQAEHALVAYWAETQELAVHLQHMELAQRTLEATRARYVSGGARQSDILRAETALHRLHTDVAGIRANLDGTRALLNAVMGRPPEAPLPPPAEPEAAPPQGEAERPEVVSARLRAEQASRQVEVAERARNAPELMVGFDYMLAPQMPDAYSVMLQVGLPWGSGRRRAEAERAGRAEAEAHLAEASARNVARYEAADAQARVRAAQAELEVLQSDLLPRAERTLGATRGDYVAGSGDLTSLLDAESALLDTRLTLLRQRAALGGAIADLRRTLALDLLPETKP